MKRITYPIKMATQVLILFLAPLYLILITELSGMEETAQREQIQSILTSVYYMDKIIICETLGQDKFFQDCEKGVFQNIGLQLNSDLEQNASDKKKETIRGYFFIVIAISILTIVLTIFDSKSKNPSNTNEKIALLEELNRQLEEKNKNLIEQNIQLSKIKILNDTLRERKTY